MRLFPLQLRPIRLQMMRAMPAPCARVLCVLAEDGSWEDVSERSQWIGCVKIFDLDSLMRGSNVRGKVSPFLDCGPYLAFLSDGLHAINYRLHVFNLENARVVRKIAPNTIFRAVLLTPSEQLLVGLCAERQNSQVLFGEERKGFVRTPPAIIQVCSTSSIPPHFLVDLNRGMRTLAVSHALIVFAVLIGCHLHQCCLLNQHLLICSPVV